ncbi:hypothetical protein PR048_009555 [Dryococelus australis]|uniref:Uncharacterized protein n=1 Tax=Dryococelus australis TaxID=614101 RepID=A0ABQ9I172_9NEOP|nr:hypothetical protein PR048_009555 [Dryococelus australis]
MTLTALFLSQRVVRYRTDNQLISQVIVGNRPNGERTFNWQQGLEFIHNRMIKPVHIPRDQSRWCCFLVTTINHPYSARLLFVGLTEDRRPNTKSANKGGIASWQFGHQLLLAPQHLETRVEVGGGILEHMLKDGAGGRERWAVLHTFTRSPGKSQSIQQAAPCSSPTKAIRVQSPAVPLPDFRMWESYRTMPLIGGFSRGSLPFPPPLNSGAAPYSSQSPSSALKILMLRAVQLSSLTHFFQQDCSPPYYCRNVRSLLDVTLVGMCVGRQPLEFCLLGTLRNTVHTTKLRTLAAMNDEIVTACKSFFMETVTSICPASNGKWHVDVVYHCPKYRCGNSQPFVKTTPSTSRFLQRQLFPLPVSCHSKHRLLGRPLISPRTRNRRTASERIAPNMADTRQARVFHGPLFDTHHTCRDSSSTRQVVIEFGMQTIDSELQCQTVSPDLVIIGYCGLSPIMANLARTTRNMCDSERARETTRTSQALNAKSGRIRAENLPQGECTVVVITLDLPAECCENWNVPRRPASLTAPGVQTMCRSNKNKPARFRLRAIELRRALQCTRLEIAATTLKPLTRDRTTPALSFGNYYKSAAAADNRQHSKTPRLVPGPVGKGRGGGKGGGVAARKRHLWGHRGSVDRAIPRSATEAQRVERSQSTQKCTRTKPGRVASFIRITNAISDHLLFGYVQQSQFYLCLYDTPTSGAATILDSTEGNECSRGWMMGSSSGRCCQHDDWHSMRCDVLGKGWKYHCPVHEERYTPPPPLSIRHGPQELVSITHSRTTPPTSPEHISSRDKDCLLVYLPD